MRIATGERWLQPKILSFAGIFAVLEGFGLVKGAAVLPQQGLSETTERKRIMSDITGLIKVPAEKLRSVLGASVLAGALMGTAGYWGGELLLNG